MSEVLRVTNLSTQFATKGGVFNAVEGLSFSVDRGQVVAFVGESGSGKSVTALSIMGLLNPRISKVASGSVQLNGEEIVGASDELLQKIRGSKISMIFQEPMTSLNPSISIGEQVSEVIQTHTRCSSSKAAKSALNVLLKVGLLNAESIYDSYPHQLSGGMRQRVMIAMAVALEPDLVIADEPTTALDVTTEAGIMDLLKSLKRDRFGTFILITHNLSLLQGFVDQVIVMYAGQVVEKCSTEQLFNHPEHPYTMGLLGAIPKLSDLKTRLVTIKGQVPSPFERPEGCRFAARCPFQEAVCLKPQELLEISPEHWSRCIKSPLRVDTVALKATKQASKQASNQAYKGY
jgi:oligopeptide/dipeptide ABC transporter ATP-binding protein